MSNLVLIAICLLATVAFADTTNTLCDTNNGYCDVHATCTPVGQYNVACACNPGYTGNGYWCQSDAPAVNLCATNNGGCDVNAACYGGIGGGAVTCVCITGFYPVDTACVAINACATNNGGCSAQATCATTLATWDVTCTCIQGYVGNGWYCALPDQNQGNGNGNTGGSQGGSQGTGSGPQFAPWDCPPNSANLFDWRYNAPTCTQLVVDYPADLPDNQANDCNIRFNTPTGPFTLNFHNNDGVWTGEHIFKYADHPNWPAGLTTGYDVEWVQVGGSNCHWQGVVDCGFNGGTPVPASSTGPAQQPFNFDWQYPAPVCATGLTVTYPSDIPAGQSNDVNIQISYVDSNGVVQTPTFNFHSVTDWTGTVSFNLEARADWPVPAGTAYSIIWVQVAGSNFHWTGSVNCVSN